MPHVDFEDIAFTYENYPDQLARAVIVDQAKESGAEISRHLRRLDYSISLYRFFDALKQKLIQHDLNKTLPEGWRQGYDYLLTARVYENIPEVQPSLKRGHGLGFDYTIVGLALADRAIMIRRIGKLMKAQIQVLFDGLSSDAKPVVRNTGLAALREITAFKHNIRICNMSEIDLQVNYIGRQIHHYDNSHFTVRANEIVPVSPNQIKEFGIEIPKFDGNIQDTSVTALKLEPHLPDNRFLRIQSVGLENEVITDLTAETDRSALLSFEDLNKAAWRLTIQDRPKESTDEAPVQPLDTG